MTMEIEIKERLARIETGIEHQREQLHGLYKMLDRLVRVEEKYSHILDDIKGIHGRIDHLEVEISGYRSLKHILIWISGVAGSIAAVLASLLFYKE